MGQTKKTPPEMRLVILLGALALLALSTSAENQDKAMGMAGKDILIREVRDVKRAKKKSQSKPGKRRRSRKKNIKKKKPRQAKRNGKGKGKDGGKRRRNGGKKGQEKKSGTRG